MNCRNGFNRILVTPTCWPILFILYFGLFQALSYGTFEILIATNTIIISFPGIYLIPFIIGILSAIFIPFLVLGIRCCFTTCLPDCYQICIRDCKDVYRAFQTPNNYQSV